MLARKYNYEETWEYPQSRAHKTEKNKPRRLRKANYKLFRRRLLLVVVLERAI